MTDALVVGAGAQARYVATILRMTREYRIVGFLDTFNNSAIWGTFIDGIEVLGDVSQLDQNPPRPDLAVITAIADLVVKRQVVDRLEKAGHQFFSALHPRASIAEDTVIGKGCIVNAGAVIEMGCQLGGRQ